MGRTNYTSDAAAELLADADTLIDWIGSECLATYSTKWPHIEEATAEDFSHATVANLVSLLFDPGQPAATVIAARDAISNRYLMLPANLHKINVIADRLAAQEAEDRRQDREELNAQFKRVMGYEAPYHREAA